MNIEEMKKARLEEKAEEYKKIGLNPDPMSYTLEQLLEHFFAEVGKLQHNYYHRYREGISSKAIADVSNLHDMILEKIRRMSERKEAQP